MKADLHCHSKYSNRPTLWLMQKLGCPESFTEPLELYHLQREKGMDAVTITDHNDIRGCLDILHLPNTFTGCEYTTYFPEDRCKVHVLVYNFSEAQHAELNEVRKNIFEFADYLAANGLPHACAHPFYSPNGRLTYEHIEQLFLLFKHWEINGDQNPTMNAVLRQYLNQINEHHVARMADKYDLAPHGAEPWKKILTAGSDCHSSLNLACAYTEAASAGTLAGFWNAYEAGKLKTTYRPSSSKGFARNIYAIGYQFYRSKLGLTRHVNKDVLLRFLDRSLQTRPQGTEGWLSRFQFMLARGRKAKAGTNQSLMELARVEAEQMVRSDPQLMDIVHNGVSEDSNPDDVWFAFVNRLANQMLVRLGTRVLERTISGRLFELFSTLGSAGALYALVAPYFIALSHYQFERNFSLDVLERTMNGRLPDEFRRPKRVAHFTDTLEDVNGVARTLQQQMQAAHKLGKDYTVITCFQEDRPQEQHLTPFKAVGAFTLPEYPELQLLAPPVLEIAQHCYEAGYTHIHISTPGPTGLAGLAVARLLGLPVSGTYHTSFPEYAKILTEDAFVEDVVWKLMVWFYDQLDTVYAPSKATAAGLQEKGLSESKIRVYPRGVDTGRFRPDVPPDGAAERFNLNKERVNLVYVGRVSREKNLPLLAEAFHALHAQNVPARLVVVGDGPYRAEMERTLAGTEAVFTGCLDGEELPAVYAACDALVFPSTTDTFGNVVLEAQAAGLPVIISDEGGPMENMVPGQTGLVVQAGDIAGLSQAMQTLVEDGPRREAMGRTARRIMEERSFEKAFEQLWAMYVDAPVDTGAEREPSAFEQTLRRAVSVNA